MPDAAHGYVAAGAVLPHIAPDFFDELTPAEQLVVPYMYDLWLRPDQRVSRRPWRFHGFIAGRGWGKSVTIAVEVNRRVQAGEATHVALMAPTAERCDEVQVEFLINMAPPWFRPVRYRGGVLWPNGVKAVTFTPEAPGRSRSENIDLSWLCEIVDWQEATRMDAFENIATATRVGRAQVIWDTTSKGRNDVIRHLEDLHEQDPEMYPITRGTTFDNPLLTAAYLRSVCAQYSGRRYEEEIEGKSFTEAAGALFLQEWIDACKVNEPPHPRTVAQRLVGVDPALSDHRKADETGIIVGCRTHDGLSWVENDLSGKHKPETWGDMVVGECLDGGAAGAVVERNHLGDHSVYLLRSRAGLRGATVRELARDDDKPFPERAKGVMYVRSKVSRTSKATRAEGPASEVEAGRVRFLGSFPKLEDELTTYEPGVGRSPNRYDAFAFVIAELAGLNLSKPRVAASQQAKAATAIHGQLRERLRAAGRGRRVGL